MCFQVLKRHMMLIHKIKAPREIREKKGGLNEVVSVIGTISAAPSSGKRPRSMNTPKKRIPKDDMIGIDDDDLIDSKQRDQQVEFSSFL
jgi:hypothetical protein